MGSHARPNWTPEELAHLKALCESGLYSFKEIASRLGRPLWGTMYKCYEQGLGNQYRQPPKYTYDTGFFSRVTYDTCYWAAILTTDGCISWRNERPVIVWGAAVKDKPHMELFKRAIQSTHPIHHRHGVCKLSTKDVTRLHESCAITFEGAYEWAEDLERHFGVTHNKTLRCPPPNLPTLLHKLCYLRGFIDGDGSVTCSNQSGSMTIMVCSSNREMIAWIKSVIDDMNLPQFNRGRESMIYQPPNESCYYYQIRGFRAAVLFELLRRLPTPHLSRKWDSPRILEHVNHWKSRPDIWPAEVYFDNLLNPNVLQQV